MFCLSVFQAQTFCGLIRGLVYLGDDVQCLVCFFSIVYLSFFVNLADVEEQISGAGCFGGFLLKMFLCLWLVLLNGFANGIGLDCVSTFICKWATIIEFFFQVCGFLKSNLRQILGNHFSSNNSLTINGFCLHSVFQ